MEEMESKECKFSDLIVTPERLDFEIEEGSSFVPPTQDLFIKKAGGEGVLDAGWDLHIVTQGPQSWLKANPMGGRGTGRVRVSVKATNIVLPRGTVAGEWKGQIEITPDVKVSVTPSVIPVRLVVKAKEEPVEPEPPKPWVCFLCGAEFETEDEREKHIEKEHPVGASGPSGATGATGPPEEPIGPEEPSGPGEPSEPPEPPEDSWWDKLIKLLRRFFGWFSLKR